MKNSATPSPPMAWMLMNMVWKLMNMFWMLMNMFWMMDPTNRLVQRCLPQPNWFGYKAFPCPLLTLALLSAVRYTLADLMSPCITSFTPTAMVPSGTSDAEAVTGAGLTAPTSPGVPHSERGWWGAGWKGL